MYYWRECRWRAGACQGRGRRPQIVGVVQIVGPGLRSWLATVNFDYCASLIGPQTSIIGVPRLGRGVSGLDLTDQVLW
jgi:hypothetical protein